MDRWEKMADRAAVKSHQKASRMGVGAVQPGEPNSSSAPSPLASRWAGAQAASTGAGAHGADPWVGSEDPWTCQPCEGNSLDAFGKGAKAPLACWTCQGAGHPIYLCPSGVTSGPKVQRVRRIRTSVHKLPVVRWGQSWKGQG